jgi:hypothetical protein
VHMDSPHEYQPEQEGANGPPTPTKAELEAALDASDADVSAGRVVALAPVLARMRAIAERIREQRAAKDGTAHPAA